MAFLALILLLCGYSLAQEPEAEAPSQPQPQPQTQQSQILSPQEIPQGFAAQLKATQQAKQPEATAEPIKEEKKTETVSKKGYPSYEAYLDSIELTAKLLLPARLTLDSAKNVINSQFGTEKNKQLKIATLEKQYNAKEKKMIDKLTTAIRLSQDIQPEWGELLQENEKDINEYNKRIDKFKEKISDMNVMNARINSLLAKLNVDKSDIETLEKKNMLYIKRMERACELMRNYMLDEEAKILRTERKKFSMTLGEYNEKKEELQINVKDFSSNVPFDYHGVIKMKQRQAETIDNETDGFTASVDYVNYPFIVDGVKVYPGAKNAHIYYEDKEINAVGAFKAIEGFDWREGYSQWATRVDSLLTGKLKYRNLNSTYVTDYPPFWTAKRIFCATSFVLSVASGAVGYWQYTQVKSKTQKANELYSETRNLAIKGNNPDGYRNNATAYNEKVNSLEKSLFARNGLFISAGAFGVAGIVSFFF